MNTDRELMQQALEALKLIDEAMPFPVAKLTIKNLSERLAQPEQELWCMKMNGCTTKCVDCPVYVPPAQPAPVQEPVGKFAKFTDGIWREVIDGSAGAPLYTAPRPCPTCEALARTVMLDQTSHDRPPLTESMINAGLAELEAIRKTELVGDYELIKRLLEAAHGIKEIEK
jgi:hypothetical protein